MLITAEPVVMMRHFVVLMAQVPHCTVPVGSQSTNCNSDTLHLCWHISHVGQRTAGLLQCILCTCIFAGCDGVVNIWDGEHKKRLFQISKYPTSIAAMAFNPEGSLLAVASSYTHEQGDIDHPPDKIYLKTVNESEVKPKPRK